MGRKAIPNAKEQIAARIDPSVRQAIKSIAERERRTESQMISVLLEFAPGVQAEIRKLKGKQNGKK